MHETETERCEGEIVCVTILYLTLLISLWKQLHRLVWSATRL